MKFFLSIMLLIFLALIGKIRPEYFLMNINSTHGVTKTLINFDQTSDLYYPIKFTPILNFFLNKNLDLM